VVSASNSAGTSGPSTEASATPAQRTFVFSDGFETGDLSGWNTTNGLAVNGSRVHTGAFAAQATTSGSNAYAKKTLSSTYADIYFRTYVYLASGSSSQVNVMRLRDATGASIAYVYITTTGRLGLHDDATGSSSTSSTLVAPDAWHAIEIHLTVNGASSSSEVWLDGAKVSTLSVTADFGTAAVGGVQIGETGSGTYDVTYDDVAVDTQPVGLAPAS
jgi:hypothetical protein